MGEAFHLPKGFPTNIQLKEETLKALQESNEELSTNDIKDYIVKTLNLSNEVLEFENSDGLTKLIDYRLRWARTALKNEGKIQNTKKGFWKALSLSFNFSMEP